MAGGWTREATKALLGIWGDASVQSQLDGVVRNKTIYLKIAKKLNDKGFTHTWEQCRTKVKNLVKAYRKVKDSNNVSGRGRKSTPFYDELDAILGTRAASSPPILLDSNNMIVEEEDISAVLLANDDHGEQEDEADSPIAPNSTGSQESTGGNSTDSSRIESTTTSSGSESTSSRGADSNSTDSSASESVLNASRRNLEDLRKRGQKRKLQDVSTVEALEKIFEQAEERAAERELKMRKMELEFEERAREKEDQRDLNMLNMFGTILQKFSESNQP